jgi:hypothetical protein
MPRPWNTQVSALIFLYVYYYNICCNLLIFHINSQHFTIYLPTSKMYKNKLKNLARTLQSVSVSLPSRYLVKCQDQHETHRWVHWFFCMCIITSVANCWFFTKVLNILLFTCQLQECIKYKIEKSCKNSAHSEWKFTIAWNTQVSALIFLYVATYWFFT